MKKVLLVVFLVCLVGSLGFGQQPRTEARSAEGSPLQSILPALDNIFLDLEARKNIISQIAVDFSALFAEYDLVKTYEQQITHLLLDIQALISSLEASIALYTAEEKAVE